MPFFEAFRLAIQSILGAKLRSFFTLLGIIVSVGFLVTVVAVIQGMNAYVKENITGAVIALDHDQAVIDPGQGDRHQAPAMARPPTSRARDAASSRPESR